MTADVKQKIETETQKLRIQINNVAKNCILPILVNVSK